MASEVGVLDVPEERIVRKWRLQPGKMLLIDMEEGRIIEDEEIKRSLVRSGALRGVAGRDPVQAGRAGARRRARDAAGLQRSGDPARSPAGLWLHPGGPAVLPGAHGQDRRRPAGLDGLRHADRRALAPAQAALRVLQAELRPGHQPAHRPDPRGAGDEPGLDDRAASEPARPPGRHPQAPGGRPADPHRRGPGQDPRDQRAAGRRLPHRDAGHHLAGRRGRQRPGGRAGAAVPRRPPTRCWPT